MSYLALAVPDRCPLGAIHHFIVAEQSIDMTGGILEYDPWIERLVSLRIDPLGKDQIAEHCLGIGCNCAFEGAFDGQGDQWSGRDGRGIGDGRGEGDRWSKGDRRGERDGWGQGDGRSLCGGRRGGEVAVGDRFRIHAQEEGHKD